MAGAGEDAGPKSSQSAASGQDDFGASAFSLGARSSSATLDMARIGANLETQYEDRLEKQMMNGVETAGYDGFAESPVDDYAVSGQVTSTGLKPYTADIDIRSNSSKSSKSQKSHKSGVVGSLSRQLSKLVGRVMTDRSDPGVTKRQLDEEANLAFDEDYGEDGDTSDPLLAAMNYLRKRRDLAAKAAATGANKSEIDTEKEMRFGIMMDESDILTLSREIVQSQGVKRWMWFDSFFGVIVFANGIVEVLIGENIIDDTDPVVFILQSAFCCSFIIEFCVRWHFCKDGFYGMMRDGWTRFDFIIISFTVADLWILTPLDIQGGGALAVLRIVRLVRMVRMARLLKQFKSVWYLVAGFTGSINILLWSVLILMIISYTFGLMIFDMLFNDPAVQTDEFLVRHWRGVGVSMLTLFQVASFDNSVTIIRNIVEGDHNLRGFIMIFVPFICIASLGFFNLLVALVLTSSVDVTVVDDVVKDACHKLLRHEALTTLHELLTESCASHVGCDPGEEFLSRELVIHWMQHEVDMSTKPGQQSLAGQLRKANVSEADVNSIYNELMNIHGREMPLTVDDFIQGCWFQQSKVHALHMVNVVAGQASMYSRLENMDEHLLAVSIVLEEAMKELRPVMKKYHASDGTNHKGRTEEYSVAMDLVLHGGGMTAPLESRYASSGKVSDFEADLIRSDLKQKAKDKRWENFDTIFLTIVCANALVLGFDVTRVASFQRNFIKHEMSGADIVWMILEFAFWAVFAIELCLRTSLNYQMSVGDGNDVFFHVFPFVLFDADWRVMLGIMNRFPKMLREDMYVRFDFALVVLGFVDNILFRFVLTGGVVTMLSLFRGLRLLRIARILYLWPELLALLGSVFQSISVVLWTVLMLVFMIFVVAVAVQALFMDSIPGDSPLRETWGVLSECHLKLLRLVLFSDWGTCVDEICREAGPWCYLFMISFALYAGLGIMNLTAGIVVQASFSVVRANRQDVVKRELAALKAASVAVTGRVARNNAKVEQHRKSQDEYSLRRALRNYFLLWVAIHRAPQGGKPSDTVEEGMRQAKKQEKTEAKHEAEEGGESMTGIHSHHLRSLSGFLTSTTVAPTEIDLVIVKESVDYSVIGGHSPEEDKLGAIVGGIMEDWHTVSLIARSFDSTVLSTDTFWKIMADEEFAKDLKAAEINPEQCVMLFQKLDTMGQGCIMVEDFIDGLHRLRTHIEGLDVASSKSLARRLNFDLRDFMLGASQIYDTFLNVVSELRGITLFGHENARVEKGENEDNVMEAKHRLLAGQNRRLRDKIGRVEKHVLARSRMLESWGDLQSGRIGIDESQGDDESITSAKSGLD